MLLLFIEKYVDLAVRLDANIEGTDVDDESCFVIILVAHCLLQLLLRLVQFH